MHLVVVCPRCRGATAVREDQRSATCPRCGRSYDPRRSRVYQRSRDPSEVARLVGEMNARLEGDSNRYGADVRASEPGRERAGDPRAIGDRVSRMRGLQRQLREALRLLSDREGGTFTSDELHLVLEAVGWEEHQVEEALRGLLREGEVLEERPDRYRLA